MLRLQEGVQRYQFKGNFYNVTLNLDVLRKEVQNDKLFIALSKDCLAEYDYTRFKVNSVQYEITRKEYIECVDEKADQIALIIAEQLVISDIEKGFYKPILGEKPDPIPPRSEKPRPTPTPVSLDESSSAQEISSANEQIVEQIAEELQNASSEGRPVDTNLISNLSNQIVDPEIDDVVDINDSNQESAEIIGPDRNRPGRIRVRGFYCLNGVVKSVIVSIPRRRRRKRRLGRFSSVLNRSVVVYSRFKFAFRNCKRVSEDYDSLQDDDINNDIVDLIIDDSRPDDEGSETISLPAETSVPEVQSVSFEDRSEPAAPPSESSDSIVYLFRSCWSGATFAIGLNGPGIPTTGAPGHNTIDFIESGESFLEDYVTSNNNFFNLLTDNGADLPILTNTTVVKLNGINIAGNNNPAGQCFYYYATGDGSNAAAVNNFITTLPGDIEIIGNFPDAASGTGCDVCVNGNVAVDPCDDVSFDLQNSYFSNSDTDYNLTVNNTNEPDGPTGPLNFDFYAYDTSISTNIATEIGNGQLIQSGSSGLLLNIGNYATSFNETTGIDGWGNTQYAFYVVITDVNGCFRQYIFNAGVNPNNLLVDIPGCTDPSATNYNPEATIDDGSCRYPLRGCTDPNSFNYNPDANEDDGSCIPIKYGCTDPRSNNYDPEANTDDGSCRYDTTTGTGTINPIELSDDEIKRIDTECKFSTDVYQTMASMRYGMTNICHNTIDKRTIKKELCAWDDKEEKVYDSVTYDVIHYSGKQQGAPAWVNVDCVQNGKGNCNPKFNPDTGIESVNYECVKVQVVTQNNNPVPGYEVINNGGNLGYTNELGELEFTIFLDDYSDPSDYVHTFGLEHCWRVEGNCRSTLIKITVNDPCDVACEPPIIDECDVPAIPGCMNPESANYNPNATVDDGSCIISLAGVETGNYDGMSIKVQGMVVDYFDITVFNGPHAITIDDGSGGEAEVIIWPDQYIPDFDVLTNYPFGIYEVQFTGTVSEYCDDDEGGSSSCESLPWECRVFSLKIARAS